jgi:2-keto-4-pentenoate hydratase
MLTDELHELATRQLADFDARTPNRMFSEPVELKTAQAYDIQEEVARLRERRGEKIIGYKVGCTSAAIQQQLGISEPIFGRIFETGGHAAGVRLSCGDYANPAVEGEFAVRLARNLPGSPLSDEQYLEAIQDIFPVIELHHFVLQSARPSCQELIASNGMHAGFVLAEKQRGVMPGGNPGLTIGITSASGGVIAKSSTISRPIESLRWLTGRLAEHGLFLSAGQIVLTGSPMQLFPVAPGSHVIVEAESMGQSRAEFIP